MNSKQGDFIFNNAQKAFPYFTLPSKSLPIFIIIGNNIIMIDFKIFQNNENLPITKYLDVILFHLILIYYINL